MILDNRLSFSMISFIINIRFAFLLQGHDFTVNDEFDFISKVSIAQMDAVLVHGIFCLFYTSIINLVSLPIKQQLLKVTSNHLISMSNCTSNLSFQHKLIHISSVLNSHCIFQPNIKVNILLIKLSNVPIFFSKLF